MKINNVSGGTTALKCVVVDGTVYLRRFVGLPGLGVITPSGCIGVTTSYKDLEDCAKHFGDRATRVYESGEVSVTI